MNEWALQYKSEETEIITFMVNDSEDPFETSVSHPEYNYGRWIIVESYSCREDAIVGHDRWVRIMSVSAPEALEDVGENVAAHMLDEFHGGRAWRTMVRMPR